MKIEIDTYPFFQLFNRDILWFYTSPIIDSGRCDDFVVDLASSIIDSGRCDPFVVDLASP